MKQQPVVKHRGLCRPISCQRVFGHREELWEQAVERMPTCSPGWIKIVLKSDRALGQRGDKRANKSLGMR